MANEVRFLDEAEAFTKRDADLVDRHQSDVDKLAKHNQTTAKFIEDEKKRRLAHSNGLETLAKARQALETAVMNSGDATRRLEAAVPRDLLTEASQAAADARHAAAECRQAEGYVATCKLALERLSASETDPKRAQGGKAIPPGSDENAIKSAQERLVRAQKDLEEQQAHVQKATEKALRLELKVAKAKEEILANARRTS